MEKKTVAVVGLGYVGLPLAILAKEKGWDVIGIDTNAAKVAKINQGIAPMADPELAKRLKSYPIQATSDASAVAKASIIVVAVPTPVNSSKLPDLTPLITAIESVRPSLRSGQVLIVESTINPGVMNEVVIPLLREREDLAVDSDTSGAALHIAHCPERINPGDPKWSVRNIPRVIGGYTDTGVTLAKNFYESIIEAPVKVMNSITEAEAVKILENTFRDVNIAFINEMAKSFARLKIDITNVIAGAATKPFAFMPHYPGNGVGGHCISVDPYYMIERGRQVGFDHEFLKLARLINDSMPSYSVQLLDAAINAEGREPIATSVALLGLAYKKNIDDLRESPALKVKDALAARGYVLRIFDPFVPSQSTVGSLEEALAGAHAVVLACDHQAFMTALTPQNLKRAGVRIVIDGKNALNPKLFAAAGIRYFGIGREQEVIDTKAEQTIPAV